MGTFHANAHALHGITCIVETRGAATFVGRVDTIDARGVVLLDADRHDATAPGALAAASDAAASAPVSKESFLDSAASVGHWPRHARVIVPFDDVVSVTRLGDRPRR